MFAQGFTRSHICSAQHLRKRAELITPILIMLTEIQTQRQSKERNKGFSKLISSLLLSSVQTGFTENTPAGNEKQMFTMKKDSMSALPSSCPHAETNSNSPSAQSQRSNLSPLGTIPTTVSSGPLRALPPELHSWFQSSCKVCTKSSCVVLCDAPTCVCRDATH